ncbi:hypothetical protein E4U41_002398, partial [Claviceps citrina]
MTSVCIIGAGHVGCALAFDVASRGHDTVIRTLPGHPGHTGRIKANGGYLEATGALSGRVPVRVGEGIAQLTESVILVAIPCPGHEQVLAELSQQNLSQKVVIFIAGNAVTFRARAVLRGAKAVLATATSPFSSRISGAADGAAVVSIRAIKKRLQICALSGSGSGPGPTAETTATAGHVFGMPLVWSAGGPLDIFLSGINGVLHVPTAVMNLGWTESTGGDFFFYRQGMSRGVCRTMEAMDRERLA